MRESKVKGFRAMLGMNQQKLADEIGIQRETLARKESDENKLFSKAEKIAIVSVFNKNGLNLEYNDVFLCD